MRITLCARSKILTLLHPGGSFRIQVHALPHAGQHVDLIVNSKPQPHDCIIYDDPRIVADLQTITLLGGQTVDYDYNNSEFIISNRGNE
jgi:Fe-S cluster assembly iron-binding protein IscA